MNLRARLTPYVLLGVLLLGTGLGIGLGLSEAPVTQLARPVSAAHVVTPHWVACSPAVPNTSCAGTARRVVAGPHVIIVPNVLGLGLDAAMAELVATGLNAAAVVPGSAGITVVSEKPVAGSKVAHGSTVVISLAP